MKVTIDEHAGFCPGVRLAIKIAEDKVKDGKPVTALGSLIHNELELDRLKKLGLNKVDQEQFEKGEVAWDELKDQLLLIRSHGVSPALLKKIKEHNISYIDGTCGRVIRSQKIVRKYYEQGYAVIIVGKPRHPEVTALLGFCDNQGIVVYNYGDEDKVKHKKKVLLIAQTTIDEARFAYFKKKIVKGVDDFVIKDTICDVISKKNEQIVNFAKSNDVIIFVGGKNSSNSKVLFDVCRQHNDRSYFVSSIGELMPEWLHGADRVGLTGGASTPLWQLVEFKNKIERELDFQK